MKIAIGLAPVGRCVFLACIVSALPLFSATYYWTGGSGDWSDVSHWLKGTEQATTCPTASDGVQIKENKEAFTITLDTDVTVKSLGFVKTKSMTPSVTLSGTRNLTVTGNMAVNDFRSLTADGPSVSVGGVAYMRGSVRFVSGTWECKEIDVGVQGGSYGNVTVAGGSLSGANKFTLASGTSLSVESGGVGSKCTMQINGRLAFSGGASEISGLSILDGGESVISGGQVSVGEHNVASGGESVISGGQVSVVKHNVASGGESVISGGQVSVGEHNVASGGKFTMSGGRYAVTGSEKTDDAAVISVTGGEFVADDIGWENPRYFGGPGSVFTSLKDSLYSLNVFTGELQTVSVAGSLIATNSFDTHGGIQIRYGNTCLDGGGTVRVGQLNYQPEDENVRSPLFLDLSELSIGRALTVKGDVHFMDGMKLGAFADCKYSATGAFIYLHGAATFDTSDAFDGTTPRTMNVGTVEPCPGASVTVCGTGSLTMNFRAPKTRLESLSVGEGATLTMDGGFSSDTLSLAEGATLNVSTNTRIDVGTAVVSQGAEIVYEAPAEDGMFPVITCGSSDVAAAVAGAVTLAGDGAEGSVLAGIGNSVAVVRGDVGATYPTNEWTGAVDGTWSNDGNWTGAAVPARGSNVYIGGTNVTTVSIDDAYRFKTMKFLPTCGRYVLTGGAVTLTANTTQENSALLSRARFPVRIESPVHHNGTTFSIAEFGGSYIEMAGNVTGGKRTCISGEVRVSGTLEGGRVELYGPLGEAKDTRLTVMDGGTVSFTNQCENLDVTASLDVRAGGAMSMTGSNRWTKVSNVHAVNGTLALGGVLTMAMGQSFQGTGLVTVAHAESDPAASAVLRIGGGLRLAPGAWETVSAGAHSNTFSIATDTDATLAAVSDWTYGPAAGVTTDTTPVARALRIAPGAVLTVDTEDAFGSGAGFTATLSDPVIGGTGTSVVKEGKGVLVLDSPHNVIPGGIAVTEGSLGWSCDGVTLPSLTFAPGAGLAPPLMDDGRFAVLTVSGGVDISGMSLSAFDEAADAALREAPAVWLAVPAGANITGVPDCRGWRCEVIELDNGGQALEVQHLGGFVLSIR